MLFNVDLEQVRNHCLRKKGKITEDFPFGEEVLVFRVFGKIFLLTDVTEVPLKLNLKCDPLRAIELRERYASVQPGYHMNKRLWNTVTLDGELSDTKINELIDHSYNETVAKLPSLLKKKIGAPSKKRTVSR